MSGPDRPDPERGSAAPGADPRPVPPMEDQRTTALPRRAEPDPRGPAPTGPDGGDPAPGTYSTVPTRRPGGTPEDAPTSWYPRPDPVPPPPPPGREPYDDRPDRIPYRDRAQRDGQSDDQAYRNRPYDDRSYPDPYRDRPYDARAHDTYDAYAQDADYRGDRRRRSRPPAAGYRGGPRYEPGYDPDPRGRPYPPDAQYPAYDRRPRYADDRDPGGSGS